eukprot:Skav219099  [mRNA]  locus=scaffold1574:177370:185828:+ [translate_table: standard]
MPSLRIGWEEWPGAQREDIYPQRDLRSRGPNCATLGELPRQQHYALRVQLFTTVEAFKLPASFWSGAMTESPSVVKRVSLLAVNLVNPRFTNFNKPLCLAITVALLSVACFVPVLGYYMSQETTLVTDESSEGTILLSGPSFELNRVLMDYAKLPDRCTLGGESKWFQATGRAVSEDGLTTVGHSCDYDTCILTAFNLGGHWSPDSYKSEYVVRNSTSQWQRQDDGSLVPARVVALDTQELLDGTTWNFCKIQDEWQQGLVKSQLVPIHQGIDFGELRERVTIALAAIGCKRDDSDQSAAFYWCPFEKEVQASQWLKQCCPEMKRNSSGCYNLQSNVIVSPETLCTNFMLESADYMIAMGAASARRSKFQLCPDGLLESELLQSSVMDNCTIDFLSLEPLSFKVRWTHRDIKTTRTRPAPLTALSSALALTTYIEMAVTLVVVVILRQLGCVKEIKKFTWGEIMNEQRDEQLEQKEMEERMEANIIVNLEANRDSLKGQQRESLKGHENRFFGKAADTE